MTWPHKCKQGLGQTLLVGFATLVCKNRMSKHLLPCKAATLVSQEQSCSHNVHQMVGKTLQFNSTFYLQDAVIQLLYFTHNEMENRWFFLPVGHENNWFRTVISNGRTVEVCKPPQKLGVYSSRRMTPCCSCSTHPFPPNILCCPLLQRILGYGNLWSPLYWCNSHWLHWETYRE